MPFYLLIALFAAVLYAMASVFIKRALKEGAGTGQTFHLSNLCIALVFVPFFFLGNSDWNLLEIWKPILVAIVFFAGNLTTFISIQKGDISLVTPLMGTKVVIVGIAAVLLTSQQPTIELWMAAGLTSLGIFLMGFSEFQKKIGQGSMGAVVLALSSATFFAFQDALLARWAPAFGALRFMAIEMVALALFSLAHAMFRGESSLKMPTRSLPFAIGGGILIGLQAVMIGLILSFYNDATGVNVVYASRGLWALIIVGWLGHHLGNDERLTTGKAFRWRIAGTILMTVAIILAVLDRARQPE